MKTSKVILKILKFAISLSFYSPAINRPSSYPYIAGDTFRKIATHIIDETNIPFEPLNVRKGDIIFLKSDYVDRFFKEIHPHISEKYILITHNSDASGPGNFAHILEDEKLMMWFGQNSDITFHEKFRPIPIGIANQYCVHGNISVLDRAINTVKNFKKKYMLYMNFSATNPKIRNEVQEIFSHKSFCYKSNQKPWYEYLLDLAKSKFVICPHGNGLDCHRTWEALLMGSFPVVKTSTLDELYVDLPVVIVNDWYQITEEFLTKKYEEFKTKKFNMEKIFAQYWINRIQEIQKQYLSNG